MIISFLFKINVIFFDTDQPPICPNGGTFYRDRCYWMGRQGSVTWPEAEQACQKEYGENLRLSVIKDVDVNVSVNKNK